MLCDNGSVSQTYEQCESRRLIGISVINAISSYWVGSIGMKMINIDSRRPPDEKIPSFWSLLIFSDPELKEMRKARKKPRRKKLLLIQRLCLFKR